jgi:hypothetical protein
VKSYNPLEIWQTILSRLLLYGIIGQYEGYAYEPCHTLIMCGPVARYLLRRKSSPELLTMPGDMPYTEASSISAGGQTRRYQCVTIVDVPLPENKREKKSEKERDFVVMEREVYDNFIGGSQQAALAAR